MVKVGHMILRELSLFSSTVLTGGILTLFLFPTSALTGYNSILDFNTRFNANDTYAGSYYFLWTNLTYLPLFFFTLLGVTLLSWLVVRTNAAFLPLALLFVVYAVETLDYLSINACLQTHVYGLNGSNSLLTNPLNRYHPLVFYSSLTSAALCLVIIIISSGVNLFFFNISASVRIFESVSWFSCILNLVALWMGSWWALQEGTWGGWWNWDSSETFGLLISAATILALHIVLLNRSISLLITKVLFMWLLILISYFFIQLNFELVSHNFGSKFFFFFNNNLFYLEITAMLVSSLVGIVFTLLLNKTRSSLIRVNIPQLPSLTIPLVRLVPALVVLVWVMLSYRPLLNYFFWNFLGIHAINIDLSIQPTNLIAAISLLVMLTKVVPSNLFMVVLYLITATNWMWSIVLLATIYSIGGLLHLFLLMFSIINLASNNLISVLCSTDSLINYSVIGSSIVLESSVSYLLDAISLEVTCSRTSSNGLSASSWGLYTGSNSQAVSHSSFCVDQQLFQVAYSLSCLYLNTSLELLLPLTGSLNLSFLAFIWLLKLLAYHTYIRGSF